MKKVSFLGVVCMSMLMAVFMTTTRATAAAKTVKPSQKTFQAEHTANLRAQKTGEIYYMSGTLKAVDSQDNTAVIDCPLKGGRIFTVAGSFTPKASLRQRGKPVKLSDFKEGQHVNVKWQATQQGQRLLMLAAR